MKVVDLQGKLYDKKFGLMTSRMESSPSAVYRIEDGGFSLEKMPGLNVKIFVMPEGEDNLVNAEPLTVRVVAGAFVDDSGTPLTGPITVTLKEGQLVARYQDANGDPIRNTIFSSIFEIQGLTYLRNQVNYYAISKANGEIFIDKNATPGDYRITRIQGQAMGIFNQADFTIEPDSQVKSIVTIVPHKLQLIGKITNATGQRADYGASLIVSKKTDQGYVYHKKFDASSMATVVNNQSIEYSEYKLYGLEDGDYQLVATPGSRDYNTSIASASLLVTVVGGVVQKDNAPITSLDLQMQSSAGTPMTICGVFRSIQPLAPNAHSTSVNFEVSNNQFQVPQNIKLSLQKVHNGQPEGTPMAVSPVSTSAIKIIQGFGATRISCDFNKPPNLAEGDYYLILSESIPGQAEPVQLQLPLIFTTKPTISLASKEAALGDRIYKHAWISSERSTAEEYAKFKLQAFDTYGNLVGPGSIFSTPALGYEKFVVIANEAKRGIAYLTAEGVYFDQPISVGYGETLTLERIKAASTRADMPAFGKRSYTNLEAYSRFELKEHNLKEQGDTVALTLIQPKRKLSDISNVTIFKGVGDQKTELIQYAAGQLNPHAQPIEGFFDQFVLEVPSASLPSAPGTVRFHYSNGTYEDFGYYQYANPADRKMAIEGVSHKFLTLNQAHFTISVNYVYDEFSVGTKNLRFELLPIGSDGSLGTPIPLISTGPDAIEKRLEYLYASHIYATLKTPVGLSEGSYRLRIIDDTVQKQLEFDLQATKKPLIQGSVYIGSKDNKQYHRLDIVNLPNPAAKGETLDTVSLLDNSSAVVGAGKITCYDAERQRFLMTTTPEPGKTPVSFSPENIGFYYNPEFLSSYNTSDQIREALDYLEETDTHYRLHLINGALSPETYQRMSVVNANDFSKSYDSSRFGWPSEVVSYEDQPNHLVYSIPKADLPTGSYYFFFYCGDSTNAANSTGGFLLENPTDHLFKLPILTPEGKPYSGTVKLLSGRLDSRSGTVADIIGNYVYIKSVSDGPNDLYLAPLDDDGLSVSRQVSFWGKNGKAYSDEACTIELTRESLARYASTPGTTGPSGAVTGSNGAATSPSGAATGSNGAATLNEAPFSAVENPYAFVMTKGVRVGYLRDGLTQPEGMPKIFMQTTATALGGSDTISEVRYADGIPAKADGSVWIPSLSGKYSMLVEPYKCFDYYVPWRYVQVAEGKITSGAGDFTATPVQMSGYIAHVNGYPIEGNYQGTMKVVKADGTLVTEALVNSFKATLTINEKAVSVSCYRLANLAPGDYTLTLTPDPLSKLGALYGPSSRQIKVLDNGRVVNPDGSAIDESTSGIGVGGTSAGGTVTGETGTGKSHNAVKIPFRLYKSPVSELVSAIEKAENINFAGMAPEGKEALHKAVAEAKPLLTGVDTIALHDQRVKAMQNIQLAINQLVVLPPTGVLLPDVPTKGPVTIKLAGDLVSSTTNYFIYGMMSPENKWALITTPEVVDGFTVNHNNKWTFKMIYSKDGIRKESSEFVLDVKNIDRIAPTITMTGVMPAEVYSEAPTITFSSNFNAQAGETFRVMLAKNGGAAVEIASGYTVAENGKYVLTATTADPLGNQRVVTVAFTVNIAPATTTVATTTTTAATTVATTAATTAVQPTTSTTAKTTVVPTTTSATPSGGGVVVQPPAGGGVAIQSPAGGGVAIQPTTAATTTAVATTTVTTAVPATTKAPVNTQVINENLTPKGSLTPAFKDLKGYEWAKAAIYNLVNKGILQGVSANRFAPAAKVNFKTVEILLQRAFAFKAIYPEAMKSVDLKSKTDAKKTTDSQVNAAAIANAPVSREDLANIIGQLLKAKGFKLDAKNSLSQFSDSKEIAPWAVPGARLAVQEGILGGVSITGKRGLYFAPDATVSRAELAVIFLRLMTAVE